MSTLIIFLAVLSLLVFVHEFGHFFVARLFKVRVDEFGIGFPPRLWKKKRGDTTYSINWIPIGGFVKLKGEDGEQAQDKDSFVSKPVYARASIAVAGVVMNMVLAAVLFTGGFMYGLPRYADDLPAGARVRNIQVAVGEVLGNSPADRADIEPGDIILSLDGQRFSKIDEVGAYFNNHEGKAIDVALSRLGEEKIVSLTPELLEETGSVAAGVGLFSVGVVSYPWYWAPVRGIQATAGLTVAITKAFGQIIVNLATKGNLGVELSGPVGIAVMSGQAAELGASYLLQFMAILSINLAIINVLPFPALDGGRLLFLMIEKGRGRPVSRRVENTIHQIGFLLLLALVLIVTYRDLMRFSDTIMGGLKSLF